MLKKFLLLVAVFVGMFTGLTAQYCLPIYANPCTSDDYIQQFSFNLINNNNTGCGTPGPSNYTNYTAMTEVVSQSTSYSVTCRPGPTWGQYFIMLIDFNQDLDFNDPNEFFDIGYSFGGGSVTNTVNIPGLVPSGITRLRVICRYANTPLTQADICNPNLTFGEVEDYSINILPPPPHEAATISVDAPDDACAPGVENVVATFQNYGTSIIDTMTMCYNHNASGWICDTLFNLGLAYGATYQHTFTTPVNVSVLGSHSFDVSVDIFGDVNSSNDIITGYTMNSIPLIGTLPYFEDFESSNGGWSGQGTNSSWAYGIPAEFNLIPEVNGCGSTNLSWTTGLTAYYNSNETSYLESPCFDFSSLTSDPFIRFSHIYRTESCCETYRVEVSTNAGTTWNTVGASGTGINWYNTPSNWAGYSSGNPGEWQEAMNILSGTAGSSDVKIRFAFASDANNEDEGIAVDNILISANVVDPQSSALVQPSSGCALSNAETVSGTFFNGGTDTIFSLNVCFNVDGGIPVCETINDTILPLGNYNYTFTGTANVSALGSHTIGIWTNQVADVDLCNDTLYTSIINFQNVGTYPYVQDFETGTNGWTNFNIANGTWAFGTPAKSVIIGAASGTKAFTTGGLGLTTYNDNETSYVQGPCFDFTNLPANPWVGMSIWWNAEFSWDGAVLQTSTNNGSTWQNVGAYNDPYNWYTDNSIDGNPGGQQDGWTGRLASGNGSNGWVWAKHPLDANLAGQSNVWVRVAFGTDASVVDDGFAFDDFTIGGAPVFSLGNDTSVCGLVLDPQLGAGDYQWSVQDTSTGIWSILPDTASYLEFLNTGTTDSTVNVALTFTNPIGFPGMDTILITIHPVPTVNLGPDITVCSDSVVVLAVSTQPSYMYLWSTSDTVSSISVATPGVYFVTVTNTVGNCATSDTIMIGHYAPVLAAISPGITNYCVGDTATLTTPFAPNILWSDGSTTTSMVTLFGGSYWVYANDTNGCSNSDSITLVFNPLPAIDLGTNQTICLDGSITLDAGAGYTYLWFDLSTNQTLFLDGTVLGIGSGVYSVVITDANSCENSDSIMVTVISCAGIPQELGGCEIVVYPNPSNGAITVGISGSKPGNMNLTVTDINGRVVYQSLLNINGDLIKQFDLTHLAPGIYHLQFEMNNQRNIQKLIIK